MTDAADAAWSAGRDHGSRPLPMRWPHPVTRDWAWGRSTGRGVRVCVVDSGVELDHERVGPVDGSVAVVDDGEGRVHVAGDESGDASGHGTACASIIRGLAPDCALHSVRVLGAESTGSAAAFVGGLRWAVEQGFDVINLSGSTRKLELVPELHNVADEAYFRGSMLVCSAHNLPVESFPWKFASVLSVGSHGDEDPLRFLYNPRPPVEFFARGADIEVGWLGGGTSKVTGNSFATAHLAGICARILSRHPGLTPFELKSVLYLTASNVGEGL